MLGIRKLGKALRGKATPFQIMMATVLAGMLGFVPGFLLTSDLGGGFMQAPGLILTLLFAVLVLNANLAVFGLTLLVAKLVSVMLLPMSFEVGRLLLDGPTQGLFRSLINAPVLAWFGLEYYATSGGLLVGLLFGLLAGFGFVRAVRAFRAKMANVEEGSERYQKLVSRRSMRFLAWVFFGGGKGKRSYRELLESRRKGLPVRIPGVIVVAVLGVALWAGHSFLSGPALRQATQAGLEQYNGATVDLAEAKIDLTEGLASVVGLAMADPNALTRDQFRARTLELKLGTRDLLQKRFVIDTIRSGEASTGARRERPAERIGSAEPPAAPPPVGDEKTLEDYLKDAQVWKKRLEQISHWIQELTAAGESEGETDEEREVRIEEQARDYGLVLVKAEHLIRGAPLVLIRQLVFEGVTAAELDGDQIDIRGSNLSTHPHLAAEPLELSIAARSGTFAFTLRYDPAQPKAARIAFTMRGLAVDAVAEQLAVAPIRGGSMDISLDGALDCSRPGDVWIDLPLQVRLRGTTLNLEGIQKAPIDDLTLPLGLRGPIAAPRVSLDDQALADALVAAGRKELADQVNARAKALLGTEVPDLGAVIGGAKPPGAVVEDAKKKAEAEALKAAEELKKRLPGGLFGTKKKKQ